MIAPAPTVRVDRTGRVWRNDWLIGWVDRLDRFNRSASFEHRTWRYVNVAGHTSRDRYPTRAAAVQALVGAA
jgi:streptogramin lyase